MTHDKKRKLLIIGVVGIFIVLPIILSLIYFIAVKPNEPKITETIDPITGETIIDGDTTPERGQPDTDQPVTGPVIYGFDNINGLYGDDNVMIALRDQYFKHEFGDKKAVKISPKNIEKKSLNNQETGESSIYVKFYIYLDDNTTSAYTMETKFNQNTGIVDITLTDPKGVQHTEQIDASSGV